MMRKPDLRRIDPVLLRDETINILLAGRDTVSPSVTPLSILYFFTDNRYLADSVTPIYDDLCTFTESKRHGTTPVRSSSHCRL